MSGFLETVQIKNIRRCMSVYLIISSLYILILSKILPTIYIEGQFHDIKINMHSGSMINEIFLKVHVIFPGNQ